MTDKIMSGGAQWPLVSEAKIPVAALADGVAVPLFNVPGEALLQYSDTDGTAWTTSTGAATLALELVDAVDGTTQVLDLGTVNLETGGRLHVDRSALARVGVATILRATPTLTNVLTSFDLVLHLAYNVVGRANESVE